VRREEARLMFLAFSGAVERRDGKYGFFGIFVEFGLTLLLFGDIIGLYVLEE
jgi:hypothetical protein